MWLVSETLRSTADSWRATSIDSTDRERESLVRRGTHRQRITAENRNPVSPRTVNKYLPKRPYGRPRGDLRWSSSLRLHAQGIIACDFFVAVTATFGLLYVFVVIEHRNRRLIHCNITARPSAAWTLQQLREVVGYEERYKFLLHDRDSIFANHLDDSIRALGIKVLKAAPRSIVKAADLIVRSKDSPTLTVLRVAA
jgi:hypothetical protein